MTNTFVGMRDLTTIPPSSETLLRVYAAGQITFSRSASSVIGLDPQTKVAFTTINNKVYVTKRESLAYSVVKTGGSYRIRSKALSKSLAETLNGYGTYRIEPENAEKDSRGNVYYPIFFVNLNKRT